MTLRADCISNQEMDALEREVAARAREATFEAYQQALSVSRKGVLRVEAEHLVRVTQDGTRTIVADAKPRRKVKVGEVVTVRRMEGKREHCA